MPKIQNVVKFWIFWKFYVFWKFWIFEFFENIWVFVWNFQNFQNFRKNVKIKIIFEKMSIEKNSPPQAKIYTRGYQNRGLQLRFWGVLKCFSACFWLISNSFFQKKLKIFRPSADFKRNPPLVFRCTQNKGGGSL